MGNDILRAAIAESGLALDRIAARLNVDPKTVERWINANRIPLPRNRQALAELLGRRVHELWSGSPQQRRDAAAEIREHREQVRGLQSKLIEAEGIVAAIQRDLSKAHNELVRYEETLRGLAEISWRPMIVRQRTITYEIGEVPEDDWTTETLEMVPLEQHQPLKWYLVSLGGSGEGVPFKSSARQLEHFEAYEVDEVGERRPLDHLHVGHRRGKVWVMVVFGREIGPESPQVWGFRDCWKGIWNPLRERSVDYTTLDLTDAHLVQWERITVSFSFPPAAHHPEIRPWMNTPTFPIHVEREEGGRIVNTLSIDDPETRLYTWEVRVRGFEAC